MKLLAALIVLTVVVMTACEEFKCVDGVSYIENECNGCFCTNGKVQEHFFDPVLFI